MYSPEISRALPVPRPSASVMLISPANEVLLLHRVRQSSMFASAHVFPGGNLSEYHEIVPEQHAADRHLDGPQYRVAAIRETFEESGILLARQKITTVAGAAGGDTVPAPSDAAGFLHRPADELATVRKQVHGDKVKFADWVASVGGVPDVDGLVAFTRWITPPRAPKRFSAQMYVYFLPAEDGPAFVATHDGGLEHTAAEWDTARAWLSKAQRDEIILYEPQAYLLHMLSLYLGADATGPGKGLDASAQRKVFTDFVHTTPTGPGDHPFGMIPWGSKVMSPQGMRVGLPGAYGGIVPESALTAPPMRPGEGPGRWPTEEERRQLTTGELLVLDVADPGPELEGSGRGGDFDRVVTIRWDAKGPKEPRIVWREDVVRKGKL